MIVSKGSVTAVALVAALVGLRPLTARLGLGRLSASSTLVVSLLPGADPGPIVSRLSEVGGARLESMQVARTDDRTVLRVRLTGTSDNLENASATLGADPSVTGVEHDR